MERCEDNGIGSNVTAVCDVNGDSAVVGGSDLEGSGSVDVDGGWDLYTLADDDRSHDLEGDLGGRGGIVGDSCGQRGVDVPGLRCCPVINSVDVGDSLICGDLSGDGGLASAQVYSFS